VRCPQTEASDHLIEVHRYDGWPLTFLGDKRLDPGTMDETGKEDTTSAAYAEYLDTQARRNWISRSLDLLRRQYSKNITRHCVGSTIDIGCGVGRHLRFLGSTSVGVDHNSDAVRIAQQNGLTTYLPDAFLASGHAVTASFDNLLFSHVLEHMTEREAADLVQTYLPFLKPGGRILIICPQERGQKHDLTHVTFFGAEQLRSLAAQVSLEVSEVSSFPLPRWFGKLFTYNETVMLCVRPST
jgi:SAM-dependent methyltransferase